MQFCFNMWLSQQSSYSLQIDHDKLPRSISTCQLHWLDNLYFILSWLYYEIFSTTAATPTLQELSIEVKPVTNWYSLGIKLGVEDYHLRTIEGNHHGDTTRCKDEMLSCWLRNAKFCTWGAVAKALSQMEENVVASKIRTKYCNFSSATGMCPILFPVSQD